MVKGLGHVGEVERRIVINMKKAGLRWEQTQTITGRSSDTVAKHSRMLPRTPLTLLTPRGWHAYPT